MSNNPYMTSMLNIDKEQLAEIVELMFCIYFYVDIVSNETRLNRNLRHHIVLIMFKISMLALYASIYMCVWKNVGVSAK